MQVVDISTHAIRESKSNPRKTFRHLEDLAKSMSEKGQLTPIIVRPLPKEQQNGVTHELVSGARRWRAATIAKLASLKAIVRDDLDEQRFVPGWPRVRVPVACGWDEGGFDEPIYRRCGFVRCSAEAPYHASSCRVIPGRPCPRSRQALRTWRELGG